MPLAVFDLDETLVQADSASLWSRYLVEQGYVTEPGFLQKESELMELYAAGKLDMADYMSFSLSPLKGKPAAEIRAMLPQFIESWIKPRIYPQAFDLLSDLNQRGYRLLIISATAEFLVRPIALELGVADVLAIDSEYDDRGCHSGRTRGILTFREGKVLRLQQWLSDQGLTLEGARFYSDSMNDLPLLERVDHPVATNPDSRLHRLATDRNWEILDWRS
ncbi:HAD family hydrolase [Marinobacterium jannaschii]|uniref:HAD family hydrolase n=1 Tax=Marinobacterium jannaschii TaxID=64970 RepID=UPI000484FAA2|nr:HAD family hydrolase [Marinobacterium jannaschii]